MLLNLFWNNLRLFVIQAAKKCHLPLPAEGLWIDQAVIRKTECDAALICDDSDMQNLWLTFLQKVFFHAFGRNFAQPKEDTLPSQSLTSAQNLPGR